MSPLQMGWKGVVVICLIDNNLLTFLMIEDVN